MRRAAAGFLTLAIALAAARGARAQTFYLGGSAADTAVGLLVNTELQLPVRAYNPSGSYYYLSSARLTFHYDPSLLEVLGVLPGGFSTIADSSTGAGSFSVSASGCAPGNDAQVLQLRVKLKPGATHGAYVWATADSTKLWYYCYYSSPFASDFSTAIAQVCTATQVYGDVDGNAKVESRDALITLSAAVGLPVNGFNLANGDVDADGLTNSRDALMMLSYAIGLSSGGRIAQGIPTNCPQLVVPGETVVFRRPGAYSGSDSLYTLGAASTTPAPVPNAVAGSLAYPRLAADGVGIAYGCLDSFYHYYNQICRINTDGSGFADLTTDEAYYISHEAPDWSPDGTKIAFRDNYYCRPSTMDANGANQVQVGSGYCGASIAWNRTGTQVAYSTVNVGLHIVTLGISEATLTTGFTDQQMIRWSPAGDSLAFTRPIDGVYVVPAAGGTATRALGIAGLNTTNGFDWGPQGILFSLPSDVPGRQGLWLLPSLNGPIYRVSGGNDRQPSFRRNP